CDQIVDHGKLARKPSQELEKLSECPSIGADASFRLAAQLALVGAKLVDQLMKRWGHGSGPPARATTAFSPRSSIGRDDPGVKRPSGREQGVGWRQARLGRNPGRLNRRRVRRSAGIRGASLRWWASHQT